jgi:hypothetical protein
MNVMIRKTSKLKTRLIARPPLKNVVKNETTHSSFLKPVTLYYKASFSRKVSIHKKIIQNLHTIPGQPNKRYNSDVSPENAATEQSEFLLFGNVAL